MKSLRSKRSPSSIMIIDDEESVLDMMMEIFEGHHLYPARDAETALDWLGKHPEEAQKMTLVFCDYAMPGKDGVTALNEIRKFVPQAKLILITGAVIDRLDQFVAEHGFDAGLPKPFTVGQMKEILEQLLPSDEQSSS
jgi:CheY-like chemotaxis protein